VVGFEPDPSNYLAAREHVRLNGLEDRVELIQAAAGAWDEFVSFKPGRDMAHVASGPNNGTCNVECVTLDRIFMNDGWMF
jgi:FkbM family methyltransferase